MGYVVRVSCQDCGYNEEFKLGQGIQDGDLDNIIPHFADEDSKLIHGYEKEGMINTFAFYRELGYCPKCKRFQVMPILKLYLKADTILVLKGRCEDCGFELTLYPTAESKPELLCIKCRKNLKIEEKGLWD
jgi:ribosomal protein S27E